MEPGNKSRHLDVPEESNRDKHVNFLAQENGETDPGADDYGELYDEDQPDEDQEEDDATD